VHDTVAAIARQPAFAQSVAQSLLGRFVQFLVRRVDDLFRFFNETPGARPVVVGAAIVVVLAIAARLVIAARVGDGEHRLAISRGARGAHADPLETARALAESGRHVAAAHALYGALLDRLASRGWIRFHSSRTSGEYARELRQKGLPAYASFRAFATRFDHLIYGLGTCDAEQFDDLMRRATVLLTEQRAA
jgi:hypothetical protein